MDNAAETVLGLDIGAKRIGVARGTTVAKLARPMHVILVDGTEVEAIQDIIKEERVSRLVIGLPRNLNQEDTMQTKTVQEYVKKKLQPLGLPIEWQDEAGSTVEAEHRIGDSSKFTHADAHAAAIILQDYLDRI